MQADQIFTNATIVADVGRGEVIQNGFIALTGDRISAFGSMADAGAWLERSERTTDVPWALILPGLVNAHTHLAAPIFRGLLDEGVMGRGLYDIAFPMEQLLEPDDIYWLGMLGCIEVLRAGCTTVNDIYYYADRLADAIDEIGVRAVLAEKVFDAELPRVGQGDYRRSAERRRRKLKANLELIERRHGSADGRIRCLIGTHATDTCSEELLREAMAQAEQLGVGLHIHVAQSPTEMKYIEETQGCTPVEYLDRLGFLGSRTLAIHCSNNSDSDIDRMAETGTRYACCPTIYPRRGRFPRLWEFLQRGVATGFGTDWIRMDPWEGMRNALAAVRTLTSDPEALPARELLSLHTMGSARVLGLEQDIGSLEAGKKADLILIDLQRPHIQPFYSTLPGVIYTVYPSDVHTVIVDGRTVVEGGKVVTVDEREVIDEVKARIPRYRSWLATTRTRQGSA